MDKRQAPQTDRSKLHPLTRASIISLKKGIPLDEALAQLDALDEDKALRLQAKVIA